MANISRIERYLMNNGVEEKWSWNLDTFVAVELSAGLLIIQQCYSFDQAPEYFYKNPLPNLQTSHRNVVVYTATGNYHFCFSKTLAISIKLVNKWSCFFARDWKRSTKFLFICLSVQDTNRPPVAGKFVARDWFANDRFVKSRQLVRKFDVRIEIARLRANDAALRRVSPLLQTCFVQERSTSSSSQLCSMIKILGRSSSSCNYSINYRLSAIFVIFPYFPHFTLFSSFSFIFLSFPQFNYDPSPMFQKVSKSLNHFIIVTEAVNGIQFSLKYFDPKSDSSYHVPNVTKSVTSSSSQREGCQ
ncbi:uncharacterized protein LOC143212936 [Lasioglossum baleicum]|uniref:uncharacterized protein LOC143212936 n=1 Tax=Lasioglossum baleicum TaxID=434251 RepID=UPI003FCD7F2E